MNQTRGTLNLAGLMLGTLVVLSGSAAAQKLRDDDVPAAAKSAFAQRYPGVKVLGWNREDLIYEVKFVQNGERRDAEYTANGVLTAMERTIDEKTLPRVVLDAFYRDYPEHDLTEIEEITDARTGAISYELDFTRGRRRFEVVYSPKGEILRQYSDD